jgi:hypothetical protein
VPNVGVAALLTNQTSHDAWEELRDLQNAAKTIGQKLLVVSPASDHEFDAAFASILQHRAGVLLISSDPFLFQASDQLIALATRHRIPAIYPPWNPWPRPRCSPAPTRSLSDETARLHRTHRKRGSVAARGASAAAGDAGGRLSQPGIRGCGFASRDGPVSVA